MRFCSAALLCLAVLRVSFFSLRSCALLWVQKAKKRTARGAKEASGGSEMSRKSFQNLVKILPKWLLEASRGASGGLWAPSGAEGGSQERSGVPPRVFLAPLGSLLAPLGALLGCSWRLLGRSGGVPGTLLGVILASLGCFLQGRLKNDPGSLKNHQEHVISTDRFAILVDVFVDPLSSHKLFGET